MRKIIIVLFILSSCSKEYYFQKDQEKLSEELKLIVATDQAVRNSITGIDSRYRLRTFGTIMDSLSFIGEGKQHSSNFNYSGLPSKQSQINKLPEHLKTNYYIQSGNQEVLWKYIDKVNIDKLYKIIKKYGYPSYDNRKWKSENLRVGVTFVLTHIHSDTEMGKKYFDLLLKEYEIGRFDEGSMRHYLWHFMGRNGMIDHESKIEEIIAKGKEFRAKLK